MNPYLFIVGCARSGTTLLRRIVDAHPQLSVIHESMWIAHYFKKRIGLTPDGLVTPELIPRLLEHPRFHTLGMDRKDLEGLMSSDAPLSYANFVSGIFDLYGKARGKRLVGDKSPPYLRRLPLLHDLWPHTKFIHLIRDGRDVCLSMMDWEHAKRTAGAFATWAEDPVSTAALWWKRKVRLGQEAGLEVGASLYQEVRFESLIADPESICRNLCDFLAVPFDDAMLRFHEGPRTDHSTGHAWQGITAATRDWRTQMSAQDLERFEAVGGDLLAELGYPRAFERLRPDALRHGAKIRDRFSKDALSQGHRLPRNW